MHLGNFANTHDLLVTLPDVKENTKGLTRQTRFVGPVHYQGKRTKCLTRYKASGKQK